LPGRWPLWSRTCRDLTSADFTHLAESFLLKVSEKIKDEIVGVQISKKSLLEISLLCDLAKFGVLDENPLINLILRSTHKSDRELQRQVSELPAQVA
jgi:hypothetical protein